MGEDALHDGFYYHNPLWQYLKGRRQASQDRKEERGYESAYPDEISRRSTDGRSINFCCQANDHYLLKEIHLPRTSILTMDRAYIDYAQFQRLTEEGICYVTKMKKNLKYTVLSSVMAVNESGLVKYRDERILFEKGELKHESRRVEIWSEKSKKSVVLLTNNFELSTEDLEEIYRRRWAIETLYK